MGFQGAPAKAAATGALLLLLPLLSHHCCNSMCPGVNMPIGLLSSVAYDSCMVLQVEDISAARCEAPPFGALHGMGGSSNCAGAAGDGQQLAG
jgi:hypothetical protein